MNVNGCGISLGSENLGKLKHFLTENMLAIFIKTSSFEMELWNDNWFYFVVINGAQRQDLLFVWDIFLHIPVLWN